LLVDVVGILDLTEGRPTVVQVEGRELAVVLWQGEVYAVRNICPHQTQSFTGGIARFEISGLPGRPGELAIDETQPVVVCPVHTWEFSLKTGVCRADAKLRVRRYPTEVKNGRVLIDTSGR
jgi:3-phenylpropionate/trans-cinnamate dioxygenase ferredoxin subunit